MIISYQDIKNKIETLYNDSTVQSFIAICNAALGGKRGLNIEELTEAIVRGSLPNIHIILEPFVNELIDENQTIGSLTAEQYNVRSLGDDEFRLQKKTKDNYGRTTGDYIVNTKENTCTCPEYINRLAKIFLPCKHQFIVERSRVASVVLRLFRFADRLDKKRLYKEANKIVECEHLFIEPYIDESMMYENGRR